MVDWMIRDIYVNLDSNRNQFTQSVRPINNTKNWWGMSWLDSHGTCSLQHYNVNIWDMMEKWALGHFWWVDGKAS